LTINVFVFSGSKRDLSEGKPVGESNVLQKENGGFTRRDGDVVK
jgi:hypothetical protein